MRGQCGGIDLMVYKAVESLRYPSLFSKFLDEYNEVYDGPISMMASTGARATGKQKRNISNIEVVSLVKGYFGSDSRMPYSTTL